MMMPKPVFTSALCASRMLCMTRTQQGTASRSTGGSVGRWELQNHSTQVLASSNCHGMRSPRHEHCVQLRRIMSSPAATSSNSDAPASPGRQRRDARAPTPPRITRRKGACDVCREKKVRCTLHDSLCVPSLTQVHDLHQARRAEPSDERVARPPRRKTSSVADWDLTGDGKTPCSTCAVSARSE
jgi:hypothetical protein